MLVAGGLMSLAIFAFSSYPLQLPEFWVVLIFLGVMSVTPDKDEIRENQAESNGHRWGKQIFLWESLSLELVCSGCKKIIIRLINNGTRRKCITK